MYIKYSFWVLLTTLSTEYSTASLKHNIVYLNIWHGCSICIELMSKSS